MATWPSIENPSSIKEEKTKGQLKSDYESGYVQSMALETRSRKRFELTWGAMKDADKQTLEDFFDDNLGATFTWTHPVSGASYTVRFVEGKLPARYVPLNRWKIDLTLEEQ